MGRFLNADGVINANQDLLGCNLFAYCSNDPINMYDPTGFRAVEDDPRGAWVMVSPSGRLISYDGKKTKMSPVTTSSAGVEFIADYESFHATVYDDGFGNPTIGYGHVVTKGESFTSLTKQEAMELLANDLEEFERAVSQYSLRKTSIIWDQNQFDAFVSLAYNSGNNFKVVMNAIIAEDDPYSAFEKISHVRGRRVLGLYRRRMDEADMFVNGTYNRTYREW